MSQKTETSCISDLMSNDIRYTVLNIAIENGARIIQEKDDIRIIGDDIEGCLYMVADSLDAVKRSNVQIDFNDYYSIVFYDREIAEYIASKYIGEHDILEFKVFRYLKKERIDAEECDFRELDKSYVDVVDENYPYLDRVEITERIKTGNIFGIFDNDKLAGFIGMHREGTVGIFRVLDEYRHQGYEYKLEASMINHLLEANTEIVLDVKTDNETSLNLQRKLGLAESEECEYWIVRK